MSRDLRSGCREDCRRRAQVAVLDRALFLALAVALALVLMCSMARGWSHLAGSSLT